MKHIFTQSSVSRITIITGPLLLLFCYQNCSQGGFSVKSADQLSLGMPSDVGGAGTGDLSQPALFTKFTCNMGANNDNLKRSVSRFSKTFYVNSLKNFFDQFTEVEKQSLLTGVESQVSIIPNDLSTSFSTFDQRVTFEHSNSMVDVALIMAAQVATDLNLKNKTLALCAKSGAPANFSDAKCRSALIQRLGRRAFRKVLTADEVNDMNAFILGLSAEDQFAGFLARLLAHPKFYYALDIDGVVLSGSPGVDAEFKLDKWEHLSRLTSIYWQAPPDDALLDFVQNNSMVAASEVKTLLGMIFTSAKLAAGLNAFFGDWLKLSSTPQINSNTVGVNAMIAGSPLAGKLDQLRAESINEILDMARHYTINGSDLSDLFTSNLNFARTPVLASVYATTPWDGNSASLRPHTDPNRGGLLSRANFLISGDTYTRPIIKGRRVAREVLCLDLPPPPPDLKIEPVAHDAVHSTREIVHARTGTGSCSGCHSIMNPLGFATENFDPFGRVRASESLFDGTGNLVGQAKIDTVVNVPVLGYKGSSANIVELSDQLMNSGLVHSCFTRQVYRYAVGRTESLTSNALDGCSLESLRTSLVGTNAARAGQGMKALFEELAFLPEVTRRKQFEQ